MHNSITIRSNMMTRFIYVDYMEIKYPCDTHVRDSILK